MGSQGIDRISRRKKMDIEASMINGTVILKDAQERLAQASRLQGKLGPLLPPGRCLALVQNEGRWFLWTVTPALETLGQTLTRVVANSDSGNIVRAVHRAVALCKILRGRCNRAGIGVSVDFLSIGQNENRAVYLGAVTPPLQTLPGNARLIMRLRSQIVTYIPESVRLNLGEAIDAVAAEDALSAEDHHELTMLLR
ncbi:MAG: hypothetical protein R3C68_16800 [Myxococcota bacterium]